jgi:hypothetical protein
MFAFFPFTEAVLLAVHVERSNAKTKHTFSNRHLGFIPM